MELANINHAMQLHAQMLKTNYHDCNKDSFLTNTIIRFYAHSRRPQRALLLFVHLANAADSGSGDRFTFPALLAACARLRGRPEGEQIHALAFKSGLHADPYVHNSLVHMYSACKRLDSAAKVFDEIPHRDVVSWTSIIDGTVDADRPIEALRLFDSMMADGITPNEATVVCVLRACADAGALGVGRRVHRMVERLGLIGEANVVTSLIDVYGKCGCVDSALKLFDEMGGRNVFDWTAMISGLAGYGRSRDALDLFERMLELGIEPDERTMTAVLSACRSSGWVCEGYRYYNNMDKYGMRPRIQHYGCMVDLLARAGHLNEAEGFIRRMPIEPDAVLWRTLIWASKLHGDSDRAHRLMEEQKLLELDPSNSGSYILMGNVHASSGQWEEKARIRALMLRRRIGKLPGCSRIEVKGVVHEFDAGDSSHPDAERIYRQWDEIAEKLRVEGYSPKASEVLLDMEDEEKAFQLNHHSEKLAVAFGLISTTKRNEILVVKNLRSCEDCHTAMKLVSRIYERTIIIRDRIRFHCFRNGLCSCGDYW